MTQISRPFAIALAAVVLLAGAWFIALKPHTTSGGSEPSTTTTSAPAQSSAAQEKAAAAPSHVDHTSTPGLEGLTRDINRAHGAVAQAQQRGRRTEEKAAQASGGSSASHTEAHAGATSKSSSGAAGSRSATAPAAPGNSAKSGAGSSRAAGPQVPSGQASVEKAIKEGRVALVLFWSPKSAEDVEVHRAVGVVSLVHRFFEPFASNPQALKQLRSQGITLQEKIAVFESGASQVASYGSFTKAVPVYQTPSILIINPLGQVSEISGFTDPYVIEQRIGEARGVQ